MKSSYFYGAAALCLLFTACKSDDIMGPDNEVMETDQTFYVGLKICGDLPVTRSAAGNGSPNDDNTDFDMGTSESGVNNAYFVFYDMNGNVVGNIVPADLSDTDGWSTEGGGETVEKYYRSVVPVSVRKGEMKPIQVICYINPISPATLQNPLNVIQTVSREQVSTTVGDDTYFAMSNSVYYANTNNDTEPSIAVPIPNDILYDSEQQANDAIDALKNNEEGAESGVITVYVERYASKLSFTCQSDPTPYTAGTRVYDLGNKTYAAKTVTLDFVPEYWALNAEAENTYVIKSFREENELGQILANNYQYGALNSRINAANPEDYSSNPLVISSTLGSGNAWVWNNPDYHRSYWSVSPAYFQSEYPEVSSDLEEAGGTIKTNQNYIKHKDIASQGFAYAGKGLKDTQYFRETTVGYKALASNNPAAAMPSVIFVGKYNVKIDGTPVDIPKDKGFYTYLTGAVTGIEGDRPYIYFDNVSNSLNSVVTGGESMLRRFLAQSTVLYKKNSDGKTYSRYSIYNADDINRLFNYVAVSEIDEAVKEAASDQTESGGNYKSLKLQANARSLQFTAVPPASANIYIATADGYCQIVSDETPTPANSGLVKLSVANATLMQQVGYAYYYLNGDAYFNIPVKHLGWYRVGNEQKTATRIDWKQVRVGDFGMVRNHSYNVNVESITGLASGIGGENVPIVPPAATDDYFVAYSVRILKWAVVPTQNVNL